jgi:DNA-binding CsgD family transcriptional regulator/sugar lactone lactonase YvrE
MCASPAEVEKVRLSPREVEVAGMVAQGLTNREIAKKLFISERTVDGHLEHVREKLGVNTRTQIATWVVRDGARATAAAQATAPSQPVPARRLMVRPGRWFAAALVLAVLAAGVGVLRLTTLPDPTIKTVAGSECTGFPSWPGGCTGGDGLLAIHAGLARPTGVAVDSKDVVYIADYGNHKVRRVDHGVITTYAGGKKDPLVEGKIATSVDLGYPSSVAVDSQDRLYVLTNVGGILQVWRVEPSDQAMTLIVRLGHSAGEPRLGIGPNTPVGAMAVAKDGTLYVTDPAGSRVLKFAGGRLSTYAGTGKPGFTDGGPAASAQLALPVGLALDKQGNLYIADTLNMRIRKVDVRSETISTVAGSGDTLEGDSGDGGLAVNARLSFPFGVAVASDGSIIIADTGNHRLRRITSGVIETIAGGSRWGFLGDPGPMHQAELSGPQAVTYDAHGNLFIADTENQRVREIPGLAPPG